MQLQVQLVHASEGRFVVQVSGWSGHQGLGSALGEAASAETAEDRAIARLLKRLAADQGSGVPDTTRQGAAEASEQDPIPDPLGHPAQGLLPGLAPAASPMAPASSLPARPGPREPALPGSRPRPIRTPGQPSPLPDAVVAKPTAGPVQALAWDTGDGSPRPTPVQGSQRQPASGLGPQAAPGSPTANPDPALAMSNRGPEAPATPTQASRPDPGTDPPADPEDWSDELAALDIQLQRLGWQREQEAIYLQRAYGHPSRSRLTSYGDLVAYLAAVRQLQAPADPALVAVPLKRVDLLAMIDALLTQLGWDAAQGRRLLETEFQRSSRQQLNNEDLLRFNMILEGELIASMAAT